MNLPSYKPAWPKKRWQQVLLVLSLITLVIAIFFAVRVAVVIYNIGTFKTYWQQQLQKQAEPNAVRLVLLGDSTMQGIGANNPDVSLAGRLIDYIEMKTGRPAYVANISVTGAKVADVLESQLPRVKNLNPDIIAVSVGANDANNNVNIDQFRNDIDKLYSQLPQNSTVVSDIAGVSNREEYQPILLNTADEYDLSVAGVYAAVRPHENSYFTYAGDFFHPSSKAYGYWFEAYRPHLDRFIANLEKS